MERKREKVFYPDDDGRRWKKSPRDVNKKERKKRSQYLTSGAKMDREDEEYTVRLQSEIT